MARGRGFFRWLVVAAALLLLAETATRVYVYRFRSPAERYDLITGSWTLLPGKYAYPDSSDVAIVNSRGFVGEEFQDPPPPGTRRIVALGDSCTVGFGTRRGHYPAILEQRLNRQSGNRRYQVINAAIQGLDSEHALRRLETAVLPLAPDFVTIYIGWNDLTKLEPAGQTDHPGLALAARFADRLWIVKGIRKLLFYHLRPRLFDPATGPESRTGRFTSYKSLLFEAHLRSMIAAIRSVQAKPILLTLPTALTEDMDRNTLRWRNIQFPYFWSAYGVGDLLDLIGAYNRSIRRVAVEQQVALVDLAKEFAAQPEPWLFFFDVMHPNREGRSLLAEILARQLLAGPLLEEE